MNISRIPARRGLLHLANTGSTMRGVNQTAYKRPEPYRVRCALRLHRLHIGGTVVSIYIMGMMSYPVDSVKCYPYNSHHMGVVR